jgi:peptidoglycan/LPS O-acetylase OafA/YrhL
LVLVVGVLALIAYWLIRPFADSHTYFAAGLRSVSMLGAVLIVVVAAMWGPIIRLLSTRIVQWLGRISFSLYLVHVPILMTFNAFLGPKLWWLSAMCTVVIALGVAELFARFIEQPAHRLSQRTGRAFSRRIHSEGLVQQAN